MTSTARRFLFVVAAALIDAQGRVLFAQRPPGKSLAGFWEFPGGKVDPGEVPLAALIRELREELGVEVAQEDCLPFTFMSSAQETLDIFMPLWIVRRWQGRPQGKEGQEIAWMRPQDMPQALILPADVQLLQALCRAMA